MSRLADAVRRLGALDGLLYLASRALARVSGGRARLVKYHLVAQPVPPPPPLRSERRSSLRVAPVAAGESWTRHFPRPAAVIARRYADGSTCLVASAEDRFAGFLWLCFGAYEEDVVRCRFVALAGGSASWDFDVYVDPAFRMGRAFTRLWDAANDLLRARGVRWTLSRISAFNSESRRAHLRFGGERVASVVFVCLGPAQLMLATVRPFVHLALSERSRPVLRLVAPMVRTTPRRRRAVDETFG
jgi:hypothetical protein